MSVLGNDFYDVIVKVPIQANVYIRLERMSINGPYSFCIDFRGDIVESLNSASLVHELMISFFSLKSNRDYVYKTMLKLANSRQQNLSASDANLLHTQLIVPSVNLSVYFDSLKLGDLFFSHLEQVLINPQLLVK